MSLRILFGGEISLGIGAGFILSLCSNIIMVMNILREIFFFT